MAFTISVTLIDKATQSDYKEINLHYCNESDKILTIKQRICDKLENKKDTDKIMIAYKGNIINNNESTLKDNDLIPSEFRQTPKIFVTYKTAKLRSRINEKLDSNPINHSEPKPIINNNNNNNNINNDNNNNERKTDNINQINNENEEKMCRICFGGEEEVNNLGQLFSPCRYLFIL